MSVATKGVPSYDEERGTFGAPVAPRASNRDVGAAERIALALVGIGLLALLVQVSTGMGRGTWLGFVVSLGAVALGGVLHFRLAFGKRPPGIRNERILFRSLLARGRAAWIAGILMTGLYVLLYWFPQALGYDPGGHPGGLVGVVDPLARAITGHPASQWFLYGVLYSLSMIVFGVRMWTKYRHNRYQQVRTASVVFFQLVFAWYLPNLLVLLRKPYMEFNGVWPLKQNYLWPEKVLGEFLPAGPFGWFLLAWAAALVIATPILTYFFGKRWYCSWVCGCGGLAETLGDPFRHLSDKSTRAWKIERWLIHGVLALVLAVTASLWIDWRMSGNLYGTWAAPIREWYGFFIGAVFSGVVGVGFYPLLGSRVWCRFGCPQAAVLGFFQRIFSRFRITTNGGQCMSCGNCSTYCEMGIDVRAYAQRGENIVRSSCVGCGICAAVCPRGVLRLEGGPASDRFPGSESPVQVFIGNFKSPQRSGYRPWRGPTDAAR